MLESIVGKRCSIENEEAEYLTGSADIPCEVLGVDGEWIRIAFTDRVGHHVQRLERVETLVSVLVYED